MQETGGNAMDGLEAIAACCQTHHCNFLPQELLSKHTTFRIGGACRAMIQISSREALQAVLQICQQKQLPWVVLGNGSNILAADAGYDGIVLQIGRAFSAVRLLDDTTLFCEAGATLSTVGKFALEASLTGMECLSGIPGTIGGAVYMNAGAYGQEMKNVVQSVEYLTEAGECRTATLEELQFSYRHSMFSGTKQIVTGVTLQLQKGSYAEIHAEMQKLKNQRAAKQPLELPSAGSTFKRPVGNYASFLIDQCGLKGASVGDAQVSVKHAGFVVNTGHATCHDVLELCDFVIATVKEKTGYCLELEPVILK
jgi:UDP-N-acetylmuramate dehydrogenase